MPQPHVALGMAPVTRLEERQPGTHWHLVRSCPLAGVLPAAALMSWVMAGEAAEGVITRAIRADSLL